MIKPSTTFWLAPDFEVWSTTEAIDAPIVDSIWVGTLKPGEMLAMKTADCLPVVVVDQDLVALGFAHIGWKDLLRGDVPKLAHGLQQAGAHLDQAQVYVGPAICANCYYDSGAKGWIKQLLFRSHQLGDAVEYRGGKYHFNLIKALSIQLVRLGVPAANIEHSGVCNFESGLPSRRRNGRRGAQIITVVSRKAI